MEASWWLWLLKTTWLLRGLQRLTVIPGEINLGGTVRVSHASSCSLIHSISCQELWLKVMEEWERDFLQCCFWPLTLSTFLMSTFPGLMDLMSGRSQDGLGATRLIKPQGLMASRREACQCLLSREPMGSRLVRCQHTFGQLAGQTRGVTENQCVAQQCRG